MAPQTINSFLLNINKTESSESWHNKLLQICCVSDPKEARRHLQSLTASSATHRCTNKCTHAHTVRRENTALDMLTSRKAQSFERKKYDPISSQRTSSTGRAQHPERPLKDSTKTQIYKHTAVLTALQ